MWVGVWMVLMKSSRESWRLKWNISGTRQKRAVLGMQISRCTGHYPGVTLGLPGWKVKRKPTTRHLNYSWTLLNLLYSKN